jgi:glycosyltransferase involved in cell wall biosynthesis
MSSFQEGFSNTMAEAMQQRCAILSFIVNPDNIISEQKAGYFSNGSKDAFFDQFTKMKNEQTLLAEFGQNGHQYINHNHRKELIAYDYAAYIHSILS